MFMNIYDRTCCVAMSTGPKSAPLRLWSPYRGFRAPLSPRSSHYCTRCRLGNAAVFLIGGLTRSVEPVPILLRSGDIIVMSGPRCRRAYHGELRLPALLPGGRGAAYDTHNGGVPRILEGTLPLHLRSEADDDDWQSFAEYVNTTRININVRQVFPHGFDPGTRGS